MAYKLADLGGVPESVVNSLHTAGYDDTEQLLLAAADSDDRPLLAADLGISDETLMTLLGRADLLRVPGVGPVYSELLIAAGINSMADLRTAGPGLVDRLAKAAHALGVKARPTADEVAGWISAAHALPDAADWAVATNRDALRAGFAPADWAKIRRAPLAAAALVVSASPSDQTDTAVELWAAAAAINEARAEADADALINVAFADDLSADDIANFMQDTPDAAMLGTIEEATTLAATALADTVSNEQFAAYQAMILDVAWKVAEASREGSAGFLGIGRKKIVNEQEMAAVEAVRRAVGG